MKIPQITEDTTLAIDFDSVAYQVASAAERTSIRIIDSVSREEILVTEETNPIGDNGEVLDPVMTTRPFKNRTEFWGRSKKTVGGWLAENAPERQKEEFIVEDVYIPEPIENALHSVKMVVESIKTHLKTDKVIGLLGSGKNHRNDILLPEEYKSDRKDLHRPIHLEAVREYLTKKYPTHIISGVESDDYVNIYMFEGYQSYKKTGVLTYAGVSIDKDQRQGLGMLFNPTKVDKKFIYPEPLWVDSIGELELVTKSKAKKMQGTGFKFLMYQTLLGDKTDTYSSVKHTGIRFGDVAAYEVLKDKETAKELIEAVLEQYEKWFPEGVKFTAFNGEEQDISVVEWANRMFCCAYMLRSLEDNTSLYTYMEKFGVEYPKQNKGE